MTKIITNIEVDRISKLGDIEKMLGSEYLTNLDDSQTKMLSNLFYKYEETTQKQDKMNMLNMTLSLPELIASTYANYTGNSHNVFDLKLSNAVYDLTWAGCAIFTHGIKDGEYFVKSINPDNYIKRPDGTEIILSYYAVDEKNETKKYVLRKTYTPGRIENDLFLIDSVANINKYNEVVFTLDGDKVPLSTINATSDLNDVDSTGLSFNPIVFGKIGDGDYGKSLIGTILSLSRSLEVNLFNVQDQFFKHLQAKMTLPESNRPNDPNETFSVRNSEVVTVAPGEITPSYIINDNPMIDKFFAYYETIIRQISGITGIPADFFGLKESGGAESANAKTLKLSKFIKRVELNRDILDDMLQGLYEQAQSMTELEDYYLNWDDVFQADKLSEAKELEIAINSQLISKVKAIMKYQGITEEEARLELSSINNENSEVDINNLIEA